MASSPQVATCESCAVEREQRETPGGVSAEDETRVVSLLRADVQATIGSGHDEAIIETAARRRLYADVPAQYVCDVVDDVQQYFHDAFVDTTWPACPFHPNHPLWFSDGSLGTSRIVLGQATVLVQNRSSAAGALYAAANAHHS